METLRNCGIEWFMKVTLKELNFTILNVLHPLFTLCNARVSALVIVLSDSPRERIGKLETSPIVKDDRSLVCV
jgi:hypothetical protein